jgi:putative transposase
VSGWIAGAILDRDFEAHRPNQKWLADVSYIRPAEGWLISRGRARLVVHSHRRLIHEPGSQCHAGHGCAIDGGLTTRRARRAAASFGPRLALRQRAVSASAPRQRRHPFDGPGPLRPGQFGNGELFFLKAERTLRTVQRSRDAACTDVFDYIERFYIPRRRHSKIGRPSPMAFEAKAMQTCPRVHENGGSSTR